MITKEQRNEIRDAMARGRYEPEFVKQDVSVLLDALDEMEKERDAANERVRQIERFVTLRIHAKGNGVFEVVGVAPRESFIGGDK